jgi:transposase-like protein
MGQVLDCWLSATRDMPATQAFFRRTIGGEQVLGAIDTLEATHCGRKRDLR